MEEELVEEIRECLTDARAGDGIDTEFWVSDLKRRYPHISEATIRDHVHREASHKNVRS